MAYVKISYDMVKCNSEMMHVDQRSNAERLGLCLRWSAADLARESCGWASRLSAAPS